MRIPHAAVPIAIIALAVIVWNRASMDVRRSGSAPAPRASPTQQLADLVIERRAVNGRAYTVFYQQVPHVLLTLTRPSREDERILLAVAGTYTSPRDTVEGYVVLNGRIVQTSERQGWDGAVIVDRGRVEVVATENGRRLTRAFLEQTAARDQSLIQVHLLVHNGNPVRFKPQPAFQRRALVLFVDGSPAIIESAGAMDLTMFAADLATLGVRDAANLDMGAWSEGWYRDPATGAVTVLGVPNTATARQTNWIVYGQ